MPESELSKPALDSWAIVELMGHVRTAGRVTEEEHFSVKLGRVDVPDVDGQFTTIYFSGSSIYCITPCSEESARAVALRNKPEPVHQYELPKLEAPSRDALARATGRDLDNYRNSDRDQFDLDDDDPDDFRDMDL